jgi:hypothetical protein
MRVLDKIILRGSQSMDKLMEEEAVVFRRQFGAAS